MAGAKIERERLTPRDLITLGIFSSLLDNVSLDDPDRQIFTEYEQACVVDNLRFLIGDDSQAEQGEPDEVWRGIGEVLEMFGGKRVKIGCIFTNTAGGGKRRDTLFFEGKFTSCLQIAMELRKTTYQRVRPIFRDEETRLLIYVKPENSLIDI